MTGVSPVCPCPIKTGDTCLLSLEYGEARLAHSTCGHQIHPLRLTVSLRTTEVTLNTRFDTHGMGLYVAPVTLSSVTSRACWSCEDMNEPWLLSMTGGFPYLRHSKCETAPPGSPAYGEVVFTSRGIAVRVVKGGCSTSGHAQRCACPVSFRIAAGSGPA